VKIEFAGWHSLDAHMAEVVRWRSIPTRQGLLWRHCRLVWGGEFCDRMTSFGGMPFSKWRRLAALRLPWRSAVQGSHNMRFVTEMSFLGVGMVAVLSCGSFARLRFLARATRWRCKAVTALPIMNAKEAQNQDPFERCFFPRIWVDKPSKQGSSPASKAIHGRDS
jgi:hypothetical protein